MERQDPYCFINQDPQRLGKREARARLAMMAAVLFATSPTGMTEGNLDGTGRRLIYARDEPDAECAEHIDRDYQKYDKQQRNQVQTKRHKKHKFHIPTKNAPTGKLAGFLDRVTDPDKEERMKELLRDPFRGMDGRR